MKDYAIKSFGVDSIEVKGGKPLYFIIVEDFFNEKVYFGEDGFWTHDAKKRAETNDYKFIVDEFFKMSQDESFMNELESEFSF